jgi:hypothetical protein
MDWIDLDRDRTRWRVRDETSCSMQCCDVLQYLHNWWVPKESLAQSSELQFKATDLAYGARTVTASVV